LERVNRTAEGLVAVGWAFDPGRKRPVSEVVLCLPRGDEVKVAPSAERADIAGLFALPSARAGFRLPVSLAGTPFRSCQDFRLAVVLEDGAVAPLRAWEQCAFPEELAAAAPARALSLSLAPSVQGCAAVLGPGVKAPPAGAAGAHGAVERVVRVGGTTVISGWALDTARHRPVRRVVVCGAGGDHTVQVPELPRPDLAALSEAKSPPRAGFRLERVDPEVPRGCADVAVYAELDDGTLSRLSTWDRCTVSRSP
jgi:hypothetical protein